MFRTMFNLALDRLGVIRQRASRIALLDPAIRFDRDLLDTEEYYRRRLNGRRGIESNAEMLGYVREM